MSKDLEETLNELGPEYRAVVARLRKAKGGEDFRRKTRVLRPTLAAASLLFLVGLAVIFQTFQTSQTSQTSQASRICAPREYCATVEEMIATQNPDGSWQNDFLTQRNAATLKLCGDPAARIAYKKAMRNLRTRGY